MYHVVANLEKAFSGIEEVLAAYSPNRYVYPRVPSTCMPGENTEIPRICVAPTIRDCFTAIGLLGRFRRCLAANEEAFSYETLSREVYPIMLLTFNDSEDYVKPDLSDVPDQMMTDEHWLLQPTKPIAAELLWLNMRSILWDEEDCNICKSVRLYEAPMLDENHPWLNGLGHPLESSEMESSFCEDDPGFGW